MTTIVGKTWSKLKPAMIKCLQVLEVAMTRLHFSGFNSQSATFDNNRQQVRKASLARITPTAVGKWTTTAVGKWTTNQPNSPWSGHPGIPSSVSDMRWARDTPTKRFTASWRWIRNGVGWPLRINLGSCRCSCSCNYKGRRGGPLYGPSLFRVLS